MNGYVKLTPDWVNLNGLEVTDINGNVNTLAMIIDDEFYIQVDGSFGDGQVGVFVWHGDEPLSRNAQGAEILTKGQQGKLVKGIDDIWVRSAGFKANLIIRKVQ